ncbi:MAG: S24 family peptidase [Bacteroidia bacterium]|jgi:phage repressor protein C with HTH and peptisase S24 domain
MSHDGKILAEFLKKQNLNANQVANTMGLSRQNLYYHLKQATIDDGFKSKLAAYGFNAFNVKPFTIKNGRPYYDVDAAAGAVSTFDDKTETPAAQVSFPGFQDCDFWINCFGDSMYPLYQSGEIIACKKIEKALVPFGEAFLVRLRDGNRYIKYIRKNTKPSRWSLVSENKDKYDPFEVNIDDVIDVWIIKGKLKRNQI